MGLVVDAQIVAALFCEELGKQHQLTDSPALLLEMFRDRGEFLVLDDGGHVLSEWEGVVDRDWFQNWYMNLVQTHAVVEIPTKSCRIAIKRLRVEFGFPTSGDVWLVRTAISDVEGGRFGQTIIVSEDCDFYDPKFKQDSIRRARYLDGSAEGKLAKHLRRNHTILVRSVVQQTAA